LAATEPIIQRQDPPVSQDPCISFDQVTPKMSAAAERRELARTEELGRRLAVAQDLDEADAFELAMTSAPPVGRSIRVSNPLRRANLAALPMHRAVPWR